MNDLGMRQPVKTCVYGILKVRSLENNMPCALTMFCDHAERSNHTLLASVNLLGASKLLTDEVHCWREMLAHGQLME